MNLMSESWGLVKQPKSRRTGVLNFLHFSPYLHHLHNLHFFALLAQIALLVQLVSLLLLLLPFKIVFTENLKKVGVTH